MLLWADDISEAVRDFPAMAWHGPDLLRPFDKMISVKIMSDTFRSYMIIAKFELPAELLCWTAQPITALPFNMFQPRPSSRPGKSGLLHLEVQIWSDLQINGSGSNLFRWFGPPHRLSRGVEVASQSNLWQKWESLHPAWRWIVSTDRVPRPKKEIIGPPMTTTSFSRTFRNSISIPKLNILWRCSWSWKPCASWVTVRCVAPRLWALFLGKSEPAELGLFGDYWIILTNFVGQLWLMLLDFWWFLSDCLDSFGKFWCL